jgi:hypothetical protein
MTQKYVKHQKLLLKTHPVFTEKWVQERVAGDPTLLGLGSQFLRIKNETSQVPDV